MTVATAARVVDGTRKVGPSESETVWTVLAAVCGEPAEVAVLVELLSKQYSHDPNAAQTTSLG